MFNKLSSTNNGTTVTEKLGLDSEVRELKFGSSFTSSGNSRGQSGAFHSIKYDFKPASVDTSKTATLEVGMNGQVSINMPHYDNNGTTVFKGSTRPYTKECVLIIDKDTGEIVLEKLSHNVQVKKTRQEGNGKKEPPLPPVSEQPGRSSYGSRNEYSSSRDKGEDDVRIDDRGRGEHRGESRGLSSTKSSGSKRPIPTLNQQQQSNGGGGRRPNSPLPPPSTTTSNRHSASPYHHGHSNSPKSNSAFDALLVNKQSTNNPAILSVPSFDDLLTPLPSSFNNKKETTHHNHHHQKSNMTPTNAGGSNNVSSKHHSSSSKSSNSGGGGGHTSSEKKGMTPGIMSDSSDSSSSSSSDEASDDDSSSGASDIDMQEVTIPPSIGAPMDISSSSSSSRKTVPPPVPKVIPPTPPPANVPGSMPNFFNLAEGPSSHVLSEDLQLSESGSDSDSD